MGRPGVTHIYPLSELSMDLKRLVVPKTRVFPQMWHHIVIVCYCIWKKKGESGTLNPTLPRVITQNNIKLYHEGCGYKTNDLIM